MLSVALISVLFEGASLNKGAPYLFELGAPIEVGCGNLEHAHRTLIKNTACVCCTHSCS